MTGSNVSAYAGFDRSDYPGIAVMAWLRAHTNLRWCGFYLAPAPSHPDKSWMGSRAELVAQGWGLAPIYLGQEVTGPGGHFVTEGQGAIDGQQAAALMAAAGFSRGSCVYLDLENGPPMGMVQREYVAAWIDAVTAAGYAPGVYCSFMLAAQIAALRPSARVWAFHVCTVSKHDVPGSTFPSPDPSTSGFAGADIWQLDDSAVIPCAAAPGGSLLVDLDSSNSADPSAASAS